MAITHVIHLSHQSKGAIRTWKHILRCTLGLANNVPGAIIEGSNNSHIEGKSIMPSILYYAIDFRLAIQHNDTRKHNMKRFQARIRLFGRLLVAGRARSEKYEQEENE